MDSPERSLNSPGGHYSTYFRVSGKASGGLGFTTPWALKDTRRFMGFSTYSVNEATKFLKICHHAIYWVAAKELKSKVLYQGNPMIYCIPILW